MIVYMAVSADEFELPKAIGDSIQELSEILGLHRSTLYSSMQRNSTILNYGFKIIKVEIEEGE